MYCIYRENEVSANIVQQVRLFKEDIDGKRADIFPNNQAIIEHTENRFFIRTIAGELLFIADNIGYAIEMTRQAEPSAIITFVNNGTGYDEAEYIQKTAPIIYRVGLRHCGLLKPYSRTLSPIKARKDFIDGRYRT